jgi:AraC-like DNA-binding protein
VGKKQQANTDEQYPRIFLYRRLVQAKLFIDAHYAEKIDLNNIADEVYSSKFHFIRQFKSIYHKTPHQYLIAVRMEKARELLKEGRPVSEVCYAVGFESLGSFSALFKRLHRITPVEYLKHQQTIKAQIRESPFSFIPACFARTSGWL